MSAHRSAYQFTHKPLPIEAFRMTEARRNDNRDWPDWLNRAWNMSIEDDVGAVGINPNCASRTFLVLYASDGHEVINWGDWIIRHEDGELGVMPHEHFEACYE